MSVELSFFNLNKLTDVPEPLSRALGKKCVTGDYFVFVERCMIISGVS